MTVWLDALDDVFDFMKEIHGWCRTTKVTKTPALRYKDTRWDLQETGKRICPDRLAPWCSLTDEGLKIENCYDSCEWFLQSAHMTEQTVPERQPIAQGTPYAVGAGTRVGNHEHSHFMFWVYDDGDLITLDPVPADVPGYRSDGKKIRLDRHLCEVYITYIHHIGGTDGTHTNLSVRGRTAET